MSKIELLDLAARHSRWLAVRQSAISGNVANANTPGYKSVDVEPFAAALDRTRLTLAATSASHIADVPAGATKADTRNAESWEIQHSGNSVSIEHELMKAGEIKGGYQLNTAIVKAYHRMLLASAKG